MLAGYTTRPFPSLILVRRWLFFFFFGCCCLDQAPATLFVWVLFTMLCTQHECIEMQNKTKTKCTKFGQSFHEISLIIPTVNVEESTHHSLATKKYLQQCLRERSQTKGSGGQALFSASTYCPIPLVDSSVQR